MQSWISTSRYWSTVSYAQTHSAVFPNPFIRETNISFSTFCHTHTVSMKRLTWTNITSDYYKYKTAGVTRRTLNSCTRNGFICTDYVFLYASILVRCATGMNVQATVSLRFQLTRESWAAVGWAMHVGPGGVGQTLPISSRGTSASDIADTTFAINAILTRLRQKPPEIQLGLTSCVSFRPPNFISFSLCFIYTLISFPILYSNN